MQNIAWSAYKIFEDTKVLIKKPLTKLTQSEYYEKVMYISLKLEKFVTFLIAFRLLLPASVLLNIR